MERGGDKGEYQFCGGGWSNNESFGNGGGCAGEDDWIFPACTNGR